MPVKTRCRAKYDPKHLDILISALCASIARAELMGDLAADERRDYIGKRLSINIGLLLCPRERDDGDTIHVPDRLKPVIAAVMDRAALVAHSDRELCELQEVAIECEAHGYLDRKVAAMQSSHRFHRTDNLVHGLFMLGKYYLAQTVFMEFPLEALHSYRMVLQMIANCDTAEKRDFVGLNFEAALKFVNSNQFLHSASMICAMPADTNAYQWETLNMCLDQVPIKSKYETRALLTCALQLADCT